VPDVDARRGLELAAATVAFAGIVFGFGFALASALALVLGRFAALCSFLFACHVCGAVY
jgi:hypothetical protein